MRLSVVIGLLPGLRMELGLEMNWRAYSRPSHGIDYANAVCEPGEYIYVVGVQDNSYARIEKRFKLDGSLAGELVYPLGAACGLHYLCY